MGATAKLCLGPKYDPDVWSVPACHEDLNVSGEVLRIPVRKYWQLKTDAPGQLPKYKRTLDTQLSAQKRKRIKSEVCGEQFEAERKRLKSWLNCPEIEVNDISLEVSKKSSKIKAKINFPTEEKKIKTKLNSKIEKKSR